MAFLDVRIHDREALAAVSPAAHGGAVPDLGRGLPLGHDARAAPVPRRVPIRERRRSDPAAGRPVAPAPPASRVAHGIVSRPCPEAGVKGAASPLRT